MVSLTMLESRKKWEKTPRARHFFIENISVPKRTNIFYEAQVRSREIIEITCQLPFKMTVNQ